MGRKKDLTAAEKSKIVELLSKKYRTIEISKHLHRDHRTIKAFVSNSQKHRKSRVEKKRRKVTEADLRQVKRELTRNPLATSSAIFKACELTHLSRSTRCSILRDMGAVKKAQKRPPLNTKNQQKRLEWAQTYLKTDFSHVLWTDEMRVTLDGPDGWARGWVMDGQQAPVRMRRQQGGGGVMVWAGIIGNEVVGPFRVAEGVKINSENYCQLLEDTFFKQWYKKKPKAFKNKMIFMQDNAPSHASMYTASWLSKKGISGDKLMSWPPCSPDLNPIENYWALLKREIYSQGRQFSSLNSVWDAVVEASAKIEPETVGNLTNSMDKRLVKVLQKKGGYINM